jgi:hypothetical protein
VCHATLQDPKLYSLLLFIDEELAAQARVAGCACGGVLHGARYPRKPRGAPPGLPEQYRSRLSFCCALCRRRTTPRSVRYLGRRVYLATAVVLMSAMRYGLSAMRMQPLAQSLCVPRRTLERWRAWWLEQFPQTSLWKGACARFLPPVGIATLPASLLERFSGNDIQSRLIQSLRFLSPLSTLDGGA